MSAETILTGVELLQACRIARLSQNEAGKVMGLSKTRLHNWTQGDLPDHDDQVIAVSHLRDYCQSQAQSLQGLARRLNGKL